MPIPNIILASGNFTHANSFSAAIQQFAADRSLVFSFASHCDVDNSTVSCIHQYWMSFVEWLSQPHILAIITAWWITFTLVATIAMCLGFGPQGVIAGSLAAGFQSFMYGGFTPAGGIFATLTSMAMLGVLLPWVAVFAALMATGIATAVWAMGVGR